MNAAIEIKKAPFRKLEDHEKGLITRLLNKNMRAEDIAYGMQLDVSVVKREIDKRVYLETYDYLQNLYEERQLEYVDDLEED